MTYEAKIVRHDEAGDVPMVLVERAEIERLRAANALLRAELAEVYDGVVRQDGFLMSGEGGTWDGWWDSMGLSHVCDAGDRLVELGRWERHPDGVGRRQFYRPLPKQQEGAP